VNDTFRLGRVAGIPIGCSDASADSEPRAPKRRPEAWLGISRDPCRPPPPPAAGGSAGREAMRQPVGEPGLRFHLALRLFFRRSNRPVLFWPHDDREHNPKACPDRTVDPATPEHR